MHLYVVLPVVSPDSRQIDSNYSLLQFKDVSESVCFKWPNSSERQLKTKVRFASYSV